MKIGPFTLTRDSAILWLAFAGGVAIYLSNQPPPWHWTYSQWMATVGAALSGASLKLQNSMLASSREVSRGIRDDGTPIGR